MSTFQTPPTTPRIAQCPFLLVLMSGPELEAPCWSRIETVAFSIGFPCGSLTVPSTRPCPPRQAWPHRAPVQIVAARTARAAFRRTVILILLLSPKKKPGGVVLGGQESIPKDLEAQASSEAQDPRILDFVRLAGLRRALGIGGGVD